MYYFAFYKSEPTFSIFFSVFTHLLQIKLAKLNYVKKLKS